MCGPVPQEPASALLLNRQRTVEYQESPESGRNRVGQVPQFYNQIGTMTLEQVAPMSRGAIDHAKLREIQAEFDKLAP